MNGRARRSAAVQPTPRSDKVMEKDHRRTTARKPAKKASSNSSGHGIVNRSQSRRDRKIALQQDVDKLRKKLRHEENVHRALERAFTRPLGALPRLPPYLPSQTLELLAEVAVLEEEVVRLEEQVVGFRQGLYQEAVIISLAKSACIPDSERCTQPAQLKPAMQLHNSQASPAERQGGERVGKENQSCSTNSCRDFSRSPLNNVLRRCSVPILEKCEVGKVKGANVVESDHSSTAANKVAEELLNCLLSIFSQMSMSSSCSQDDERASSSPSVSGSCGSSEGSACTCDPYCILEFGSRDIGPYKLYREVDATSFHQSAIASNNLLGRRLKAFLRKLSSVDLVGLSHQQKLAFWINTYNSCMMNAFLEQGAPTTPHMLVAMMPKATINVSGRVLSAMTIEHFILRLPYKHVYGAKGVKAGDDVAARGVFGLEWPEPLVTFALSCGSWSSPAVRVYTATHVDKELEAAKRDYLQAAAGDSTPSRLTIPKLLHWYLPDFAKDVSSLMDWVCLQLPSELQHHAVQVVEAGRQSRALTVPVQVMPYEFRFRYLLAS